jgi:hypothetical protein
MGIEEDRQSESYRRALLQVRVDDEIARLEEQHGEYNAPIGGWRNRAVENIAEREGMNPYTLDHLLRGIAGGQRHV